MQLRMIQGLLGIWVLALSILTASHAVATDDFLANYSTSKWHGGSVDKNGDNIADFCIMIPKRPADQVLLLLDTTDGFMLGMINPLWQFDEVGGLIDVDVIVPGRWNSSFSARVTDSDTIAVTVGPVFEVIEAIQAGNELFAHHYIGDFETSLLGTHDAVSEVQRCFRDHIEPHLSNNSTEMSPVTSPPPSQPSATYQEGKDAFDAENYSKALEIWQQAARQGNAKAMNGIGQLHQDGLGLRQDYRVALSWYKQAAELGLDEAQFNLARLYDKGQGMAVDYDQAVAWYQKSAEQGYARAQLLLGIKSLTGQGVPKDLEAARHWYLLAAQNGNRAAQFNLATLLRQGRGGAKDPEQAVYWYRRSAAQGHAFAQLRLGDALSKGLGAPKDPVEAYMWYLLASENGKDEATAKIQELRGRISQGDQREATVLASQWSEDHEPVGSALVAQPMQRSSPDPLVGGVTRVVTKPLPDDLFGLSEADPAPATSVPPPAPLPVARGELRVEGCYDLSQAASTCQIACNSSSFAEQMAGSQFVRKNGAQAPVQYCLNGCEQAAEQFSQALNTVAVLSGSKFFCPMLYAEITQLTKDNRIPGEHGDKSARKSHATGSDTYIEATQLEATPEQLARLSQAAYSSAVQALVDQMPPALEGCYDTTGSAAMDHCRAECIDDARFPGTGLTSEQALALCNTGCDRAVILFRDQAIWQRAKNEDGLSGTFCSAIQFTDIARNEIRNQALVAGHTKQEAAELVGGLGSYWRGVLIAGGL